MIGGLSIWKLTPYLPRAELTSGLLMLPPLLLTPPRLSACLFRREPVLHFVAVPSFCFSLQYGQIEVTREQPQLWAHVSPFVIEKNLVV